MWMLSALIPLGVVAAVLLFITFGLDDWQCDLTTNWATTDADAADDLLRPLQVTIPANLVIAAVRDWTGTQPQWTLTDEQSTGDVTVLHLVRTTRLMRFRDDVTLRVQKLDDGNETLVTAESRSRVGRADFGQNARNLKESRCAARDL
jgi:uncharacterized protein (DUF1499 family)